MRPPRTPRAPCGASRRGLLVAVAAAGVAACSPGRPPPHVRRIDPKPRQSWRAAHGGGPAFELALGRDGHLAWRVTVAGRPVLDWAALGLALEGLEQFTGLRFEGVASADAAQVYDLAVGKASHIERSAVRRRFDFRNAAGRAVALEVHAQADGVAFRYLLPGLPAPSTITAEATTFAPPVGSRLWAQPYDWPAPYKFAPAYEQYFRRYLPGDEPLRDRLVFPLLLEHDGQFALVSDSGGEGYAGIGLAPTADGRALCADFPPDSEGAGEGASRPVAGGDTATPWRTVAAGDLQTIVASTLVTDVAPPLDARFGGRLPAWVQAGKAAWDWWNDRETGPALEQFRYVDAAREFGWDYVLVDAGWDRWAGDVPAQLADLCAYGAARNVGIWLWYNSGGPNNTAKGGPRDLMHQRAPRRAEFARIAALGVRGVKVDFWHSDKPLHLERALGLIADAADAGLMVNLHGCTLPRGWERRFPNLMTLEAVRGGETYQFPGWYKLLLRDKGPTALDAVRYVFTRNVVGPMDFTPLVFEAALRATGVRYGFSLAQAVLFESGVQHFADTADDPESGYRRLFRDFPFVRSLLAAAPAAWDETRLLVGHPDTHAVLARRKGDVWWIAGASAAAEALPIEIPLAPLSPAGLLEIASDGAHSADLTFRARKVAETPILKMSLPPRGGFLARLGPGGERPICRAPTRAAPRP